MSRNVRRMSCTPEDVFAVMADGWLYPSWVVGASRMRSVDEAWPAEGAQLHHSFGVWPLLIDDTTEVREYDAPRRVVLRARGWPVGEARVLMEVRPSDDGCVVRITEDAVAGPGSWIPRWILNVPLHLRNAETLQRLAFLAEGRAAKRG
ncbi:SRPBCC family protein [Microbacterium neimengense]